MKKMVKIIALAMVAVMLMLTLASCGAKPNSDPAKAKEKLEKEGYEVMLIEDETALKMSGLDGLVASLTAMKGDSEEDAQLVTIYYFKDADSAKKAEEKDVVKKAMEEAKEEDDVSTGRSGKMIWFGTKEAVKAAG